MTVEAAMAQMTEATIKFQMVLVDRFTPVLMQVSNKLGRMMLDYYLSLPWWSRLTWDLRTGRFWRNIRDAFRELAP